MREILTRSGLYITPKAPFKNWVKKYHSESNTDIKAALSEKHVFLIDSSSYGKPFEIALLPHFEQIFEYELSNWSLVRNEWPQDRSLEIFLNWFEVHHCDEIIDLETDMKEPDIYDELSFL